VPADKIPGKNETQNPYPIESKNVWEIYGEAADKSLNAIKSEGLSKQEIKDRFECAVGVVTRRGLLNGIRSNSIDTLEPM